MVGEVCRWPIKRPGMVCIGPARYDSLYLNEFAPPNREDYPKPKTGGGWHRSASRQVYIHTPYKTEKSLYSIEFGRVKVPGQSDFQPLRKRVVPYIPVFPGEPKPKIDGLSFPNEMMRNISHHLVSPIVTPVIAITRCGREVEREGPDGPPDFEDTLYERGRCCHGDHKRYVSKAENPTRYPFSKYDPQFVDYDRHLTPPKKSVKLYPKRVTEDDVRNNPPSGWQGTKGFFQPEAHGRSSESGLAAADRYYALVRPLEGTLLAMNANRSIKSRVMM